MWSKLKYKSVYIKEVEYKHIRYKMDCYFHTFLFPYQVNVSRHPWPTALLS